MNVSTQRRLELFTNGGHFEIFVFGLKSSKTNKQTVTKMNKHIVHTKQRISHHFATGSLNVTLTLPYIMRFSFVGNILNRRL